MNVNGSVADLDSDVSLVQQVYLAVDAKMEHARLFGTPYFDDMVEFLVANG